MMITTDTASVMTLEYSTNLQNLIDRRYELNDAPDDADPNQLATLWRQLGNDYHRAGYPSNAEMCYRRAEHFSQLGAF